MRNSHKYILIGLVAGAFFSGQSWATPATDQADGTARKALELKQYTEVLRAYSGIAPQDLNDQSFYRLAIAQQRLGNAADARNSLAMALKLNPKGSFASSPERLAQLQTAINDGLAASATIEPAKAELPAPTPAAAASSVVTPPPSSSPNVQVSDVKPVSIPMVPDRSQKTLNSGDIAPVIWLTAIFLILLLVSFVAGLAISSARKLKAMRVTAENSLAVNKSLSKQIEGLMINHAKPVSDVGNLVALREEVLKVRRLIAAAGTENSALDKALEKLEPMVVMEIGRNHFRSNRDPASLTTADQMSLESVAKLEPAAMLLDAADPEAVMGYLYGGPGRFAAALNLDGTGTVVQPASLHR